MITQVALDMLEPNPWQTRTAEPEAEYIQELAEDISRNGLLQVPIGRTHPDDVKKVQLAFGHNRLAAWRSLNKVSPFPVNIIELSDKQMANFAWSENEKRRDLSAIERARAIDKRMIDFGWTNRQVAENLGIDHSTISNILRLLKLPEDLQDAIQDGRLSERSAMALLTLYEAPEFPENYWKTKRGIIGEALGGASSDFVRKQVDEYLKFHGVDLNQAAFKVGQLIPEGGNVYCGLCSECDKRMANRNLCFDKLCFEAKTAWVRHKYLEGASLATGFNILDPDKSGYPTTLYGQQVETIKAAKCSNLVLAYGPPSDEGTKVPGFAKAHLTCEKRNQSCTCIRGLRANLTSSAPEPVYTPLEEDVPQDGDEVAVLEKVAEMPATLTSIDLEEAARQARKEKKYAQENRGRVLQLIIERIAEGLKADEVGAFYLVAFHSTYPLSRKGMNIDECYRKLASDVAHVYLLPDHYESMREMIESVNRRLENLGLEPVSLEKTLVEVFQDEEKIHE